MTRGRLTLRTATEREAKRLHTLISANMEDGRLLPRTLAELRLHAPRFVVAVKARKIVGCAELAPLSAHVAEVRSLAVDPTERGQAVGSEIVDELRRRARRDGFEKLCAFTHAPAYFINMGFSIVPHSWILEKVLTDCVGCSHFGTCGKYAMVVPVEATHDVHEHIVLLPRHA